MSWNTRFYRDCVYRPITWLRGESPVAPLRALLQSQSDTPDIHAQRSQASLTALLTFAREEVPYYRERLTPALPFNAIPLLGKRELREQAQSLRALTPTGKLHHKTSGGSTGAPVTVAKNAQAMAWELAAAWRGFSWAGVGIGDKQARFWGVPHTPRGRWRARLIDWMANRERFSAFGFSDAALGIYVARLNRSRPVYFYGYVSLLRELAQFLQRRQTRLTFTPRAIITTSELLNPCDRALFQTVFGAPVFNEYGCGEIGTIAHECAAGQLHINVENVYLEILDEAGQAVAPGTSGQVVVTDLRNYAMPLIRYQLGDYASLGTAPCRCGMTLPVLQNLHGRAYDILLSPDGTRFHGEFFLYLLEDAKSVGLIINGIQIEQTQLRQLVLRVVADSAQFDAIAQWLTTALRKKFAADVEYIFIRVEAIAREASGKLRVIKRAPEIEL